MKVTLDWYRICLSRDEYAGGVVDVLLGAFRACYIAANGPPGMAMWGAVEASKTGYYHIYLTPPSLPHVRALVKAYAAEPVSRPARSGIALLYGDPADAFLAFEEF